MSDVKTPWFDTFEEIEDTAGEALRSTGSGSGYVYVLECERRENDSGTFANEASRHFNCEDDEIPSWAWAAFYSDEVFYVGSTTDFYNRLIEHCTYLGRSTMFTKLFPVRQVFDIEAKSKPADAMNGEMSKPSELKKEYPESFVYQN